MTMVALVFAVAKVLFVALVALVFSVAKVLFVGLVSLVFSVACGSACSVAPPRRSRSLPS